MIARHDVAVGVDDEAGADAPARYHGAGLDVRREAESLGEVLAEEAFEVLRHTLAAPLLGGERGAGPLWVTSIETTAGLTASTTPARLGVART